VNFLGTIDDQPLELRAAGYRALRLESPLVSGELVNVIGGHEGNDVFTTSNEGKLRPGYNLGSVVAGGAWNVIESTAYVDNELYLFEPGDFSAISGGLSNRTISAVGSVIAGCGWNHIQSEPVEHGHPFYFSAISGGASNTIRAGYAVIAGGYSNSITVDPGRTHFNVIAGGAENEIGGSHLTGGEYDWGWRTQPHYCRHFRVDHRGRG
jgi:hypothetical protein